MTEHVEFSIRKVRSGSSGWGTQYAVLLDGETVGYVSGTGSGRSWRRWEGHRVDGAPTEHGRTFVYGPTRQSVAESIALRVHRETVGGPPAEARELTDSEEAAEQATWD